MTKDPEEALLGLVRMLKPLSSEERHRAVSAAMTYLGETYAPNRQDGDVGRDGSGGGTAGPDLSTYPKAVGKWMNQNGITSDELDQVVQFNGDGTFAIHDVPGKTKKEQTLNVYIMAGVCTFLSTGERVFDDATARRFCEDVGCLDKANHAAILSGHGPEFSGDKNKGYNLSNIGLKKGAVLVKEFADADK